MKYQPSGSKEIIMPRVSEEVKQEVVDFAAKGVPVSEIADELGVSTSYVYKVLGQSGASGEYGGPGIRKTLLDMLGPEVVDELVLDYKAGMAIREIVGKYSLAAPATIYAILAAVGVETRINSKEMKAGKILQLETAIKMYKDGTPYWKILQETGISNGVLNKELHARGIRLRRAPYSSRIGDEYQDT